VEKAALHERLRALLDMYLADNRQAWDLLSDGAWRQRTPSNLERASHAMLLLNSWGIVEGGVGGGLWTE
jgi:polyphosphate kinase